MALNDRKLVMAAAKDSVRAYAFEFAITLVVLSSMVLAMQMDPPGYPLWYFGWFLLLCTTFSTYKGDSVLMTWRAAGLTSSSRFLIQAGFAAVVWLLSVLVFVFFRPPSSGGLVEFLVPPQVNFLGDRVVSGNETVLAFALVMAGVNLVGLFVRPDVGRSYGYSSWFSFGLALMTPGLFLGLACVMHDAPAGLAAAVCTVLVPVTVNYVLDQGSDRDRRINAVDVQSRSHWRGALVKLRTLVWVVVVSGVVWWVNHGRELNDQESAKVAFVVLLVATCVALWLSHASQMRWRTVQVASGKSMTSSGARLVGEFAGNSVLIAGVFSLCAYSLGVFSWELGLLLVCVPFVAVTATALWYLALGDQPIASIVLAMVLVNAGGLPIMLLLLWGLQDGPILTLVASVSPLVAVATAAFCVFVSNSIPVKPVPTDHDRMHVGITR